jgi:uncharacterized protein (TIGR03083 family)
MNLAVTRIDEIPALDHDAAMVLAGTEYDRWLELLPLLSEQEWHASTHCPGWDVKAVAGHVLGMLKRNADPEEAARQDAAAAQRAAAGENWLEALTDNQVRDHADLSTDQVVAQFRETAPAALAGRRSTTPELREQPFITALPGEATWTLGYLLDVILTRDPWRHRVDICDATGHQLILSADHDGRIIADVVADWARRHGQPVDLELTGTAGGHYSAGTGGESITIDAVEFARQVSGIGHPSGLLSTFVPF